MNIGNTAFKRYSKIYMRSENWLKNYGPLEMPVSLITDVDVYPLAYYSKKSEKKYKYYINLDSQVDQLIQQGLSRELTEEMKGMVFNSKTQLSDFLSSRDFKVPKDNLDEMLRVLKVEIDQEVVEKLRLLKKKKIEEDFKDDYEKIKTFVANNWTLEYELALSDLDEYLIDAIHEARFDNPNSNANIDKFNEWMDKIESVDDVESRSYEIYEPLLKKNASKAITAQVLAEKLKQSEDKEKIKKMILESESLKYLSNAIYHVTEKEVN